MKDVQTFLEAYHEALQTEVPCALATVVSVVGSAYRRPGARMLVYADGRRFGSLSGGCLESDVAAHALQTLKTGQAVTVRYDPNHENGDVIVETGCKGKIGILVEPLAGTDGALSLDFLSRVFQSRMAGMMATVFEVEGVVEATVGDRWMLSADRRVSGTLHDSPLTERILQDVSHYQGMESTRVVSYRLPQGTVNVLLENLVPPIALVLCGSGHDTMPLAKFATAMGWQVTVADSNSAALTAERFPDVNSLLAITPTCLTSRIVLDARTAAVVMTHRYAVDLEWFRELLPSPVSYLGVLGPRHRWQRMQVDLAAEAGSFLDDDPTRVHSPAGLDIGSETPEEIALAIVAEIQAVMAGRAGGFLLHREASIHSLGRENASFAPLTYQPGRACPL